MICGVLARLDEEHGGRPSLGLDDRWMGVFVGSGEPSTERFPKFEEDIRYAREKGLKSGVLALTGRLGGLSGESRAIHR